MNYRFIIATFPRVPFINLYDYWNNLATNRKLKISPTMDVIRARFHKLAFGS